MINTAPQENQDMDRIISDQKLLKRLVLDEGKLHDLLYGKWVEWNGRRPPDYAKKELLQTLPKEKHQISLLEPHPGMYVIHPEIHVNIDILNMIPSEVFLDISTLSPRRIGVFAAIDTEEKTVLGPVLGKCVDFSDENAVESMWEILDDKGCVFRHLQTLDADTGSWMGLIQCARYPEEQNLEIFQDNSQIFYKVTKHIQIGDELLVWYSNQVPQCFGIPDFEPETCKNTGWNNESENPEVYSVPNSDDEKKKVSCVLCHKGFNSRSNLRSHMRTHTNQKPFKCSTCGRGFSQSSTLRNHIRLHTGEKPYKCSNCQSAYSQLAGLRAHQKSSQHRPKNFQRTIESIRD